jgi:phytoene dehydrogenase-like protein
MPFGLYSVNHPDFGGNQGVVELYAQRLRELGGEIRFDQMPHEILVEDGRAVGVRARTSTSFVREVRAKSIVFTSPAYRLFDLVDASRFPADFVAKAWSVKKYETPLMSLFVGLRALPRRRRDGQPEDTMCFQRLLIGPERRLGGGWSLWSNGCTSLAPPGKHLLGIHLSDAFASFDEAKARFTQLVDYVRSYYVDLEDVAEWHEYEWITEAQSMPWTLKTDERAPMRTPIGGLFLAGYSTEVLGADYDAEANSAMQVADMILGEGV